MRDTSSSDGITPIIALLLVLLLLGGGGLFFWRVQQSVAKQRAEAEAAAEAEAVENLIEAIPEIAKRAAEESLENSIQKVLLTQQQAWNAGDIDLFMQSYWKSGDLTFSSGGKVTRGWQATLDNYRQRYSTRREMGRLKFDNLEITPLGPDAALVLGEWKLTRDTDDLGGNFTLVFRRINGEWLIIHDHTSRSESP